MIYDIPAVHEDCTCHYHLRTGESYSLPFITGELQVAYPIARSDTDQQSDRGEKVTVQLSSHIISSQMASLKFGHGK